MCLESFHQLLIRVVLVWYPSQLESFLAAATSTPQRERREEEGEEDEEAGASWDEKLHLIIRHFQVTL